MGIITFNQIHKYGQVVVENDLYKQVHNPEMLLQYDSNFISFKQMPALEEFKEAESYLRTYHEKHGQKHVRFYFPEGETLSAELTHYLKDQENYAIGFLELYSIQPSQFPKVSEHPDINVQQVTAETLDTYLKFQYDLDCVHGHAFAEQKQGQYLQNQKDAGKMQLMAFYKGNPAGSVDVIITEKNAEIDGLMVKEEYQKKGIGSRLQKFVMDQFHDKTVILVADGEDTPKEMYQKQNYQYIGFQFECMKVYQSC